MGEAEALGYTELDPSSDIEGFDAAQKTAILSSIAFNAQVVAGDVHREGIARVSAQDISAAHDLGYEIKLLSVSEVTDGAIAARVHPAMIPRTHPFANVRDVFNAIFVEGEESGELMFFGRGAGGGPTGSAIVGDVAEVARHIVSGGTSIGWTHGERARIIPLDSVLVRYYVVLSVRDEPGVLAAVAGVFADHGVSIASVRQEGSGVEATLALITHVGRRASTVGPSRISSRWTSSRGSTRAFVCWAPTSYERLPARLPSPASAGSSIAGANTCP